MQSTAYEVRPHHAFAGWYLVYYKGICLRAFGSKLEADEFVNRHARVEDLKSRKVTL